MKGIGMPARTPGISHHNRPPVCVGLMANNIISLKTVHRPVHGWFLQGGLFPYGYERGFENFHQGLTGGISRSGDRARHGSMMPANPTPSRVFLWEMPENSQGGWILLRWCGRPEESRPSGRARTWCHG